MVSNNELKVAMVSVVSEVLKLRKENEGLDYEGMMRKLEKFIDKKKNKNSRLMMIVAASKTLDVINRNPKFTDKEVMNVIVKDLNSLINNAN